MGLRHLVNNSFVCVSLRMCVCVVCENEMQKATRSKCGCCVRVVCVCALVYVYVWHEPGATRPDCHETGVFVCVCVLRV